MAPRNVSGTWTIEQSNGWRTDVTLTQNGSELSGTARTSAGLDEDFSQELDGTVSGTNFALWGCPALTDRADNSVRLHS
jgi:hypothetical protein